VSTLSPFALFEAVDDVPPELEVRFDPVRLDLAVVGADEGSGVPPVEPGHVHPLPAHGSPLRRYTVVDAAGNELGALIRVREHCGHERSEGDHRLEAAIVSLQYGDGPMRTAPGNELTFAWTVDRHGVLKRLDQELTAQDGHRRRTVSARFDAKRGVTMIRDDAKKRVIERQGLVLLRLATKRGTLLIEY
jgi:hypothetical protein